MRPGPSSGQGVFVVFVTMGMAVVQDKTFIKNLYPWTSIIQARRLGHAVLETPDMDRQVEFYTDLVGFNLVERTADAVWLASRAGQLALEFRRGEQANCKALSFEVASGTDFGAVQSALSEEGIAAELRSDATPGMPEALVLHDPKGTEITLFQGWGPVTDNLRMAGVSPLKFGHIAFSVKDLQGMVAFYKRVLGFRESDWIEDYFAFLRCNADHHTANFIQGHSGRMHHIAFELQDAAHMRATCDLIGQHGKKLIWGPGRHSVGHNMFAYHRDPDDHIIEYYCELDQMQDEALGYYVPRPWHQDFPQRPRVWSKEESMSWGLPPAEDFRRQREI